MRSRRRGKRHLPQQNKLNAITLDRRLRRVWPPTSLSRRSCSYLLHQEDEEAAAWQKSGFSMGTVPAPFNLTISKPRPLPPVEEPVRGFSNESDAACSCSHPTSSQPALSPRLLHRGLAPERAHAAQRRSEQHANQSHLLSERVLSFPSSRRLSRLGRLLQDERGPQRRKRPSRCARGPAAPPHTHRKRSPHPVDALPPRALRKRTAARCHALHHSLQRSSPSNRLSRRSQSHRHPSRSPGGGVPTPWPM